MGIGPQLKAARLSAGYTQESLANAIGVTKGAIGNYENEVSHPREDILYSLLSVLNIDANTLFAWPTKKEPPAPEGAEGVPDFVKFPELYHSLKGLSNENLQKVLEYVQLLKLQQDQGLR